MTLMTHGGDDVSLIPGWMSPSGGEEETLFCSVLTGSSRTCAQNCSMLIMRADDGLQFFCLYVCVQIQRVSGSGSTLMHTHTPG